MAAVVVLLIVLKIRCAPATGQCAPGFLKFFLCGRLYMCVCLCVCLPPRLLITRGVMWHDMDPIRLVKQVLQLLYGNCSCYH